MNSSSREFTRLGSANLSGIGIWATDRPEGTYVRKGLGGGREEGNEGIGRLDCQYLFEAN